MMAIVMVTMHGDDAGDERGIANGQHAAVAVHHATSADRAWPIGGNRANANVATHPRWRTHTGDGVTAIADK